MFTNMSVENTALNHNQSFDVCPCNRQYCITRKRKPLTDWTTTWKFRRLSFFATFYSNYSVWKRNYYLSVGFNPYPTFIYVLNTPFISPCKETVYCFTYYVQNISIPTLRSLSRILNIIVELSSKYNRTYTERNLQCCSYTTSSAGWDFCRSIILMLLNNLLHFPTCKEFWIRNVINQHSGSWSQASR